MRKKILLSVGAIAVIVVLATIIFTVSGFLGSTAVSQPITPGFHKTVIDMSGRTVSLPASINRVAILSGPCTPDMYIVNASDKISAITDSVKKRKFLLKIDPSLKDKPTPRMGGNDMSLEELFANDPDICIGYISDIEAIDQHSNLTTISLGTPASNFTSQKEEIRLFGQIFGREKQAEAYVAYLNNTLNKIAVHISDISDKDRKSVYFGFGTDYLTTYGNNTFMQERLEAAGCRNSAESIEPPLKITEGGGSQTVNIERVLTWNPDIIIIEEGTPDTLYADPKWKDVTAIKEKQVYVIPEGSFRWNRRSAEGAVLFTEWMAITAYPQNFTDVNYTNDLKDFYLKIFNYKLNDSDIQMILHK